VTKNYYLQEAHDREVFYNTGLSVPFVIFDGTEVVWEASPANYDSVYAEYIDAARRKVPYFNLSVDSAVASPTVGRFDLKIVAADTIPDDEILAFVAITEDSLPGNPFTFMHVVRSLQQFPLDLAYPDSLDTTITFSHNIPPDNMKTVIFIQNMDTKEIMQAIMREF